MGPTPQEVPGFTTIDQVGTWAGLGTEELAKILDGLGSPANFLQVPAIPQGAYSETINLVRITGPPQQNGDLGPVVPRTPVGKGKANQFLRAASPKWVR